MRVSTQTQTAVGQQPSIFSPTNRRPTKQRPRLGHPHPIVASAPASHPTTSSDDAPSTSQSTAVFSTSRCSRRHMALSSAALLASLTASHPALASKMITLRDGTQIAAYEHGMSISIVALRGSMPAQWAMDFKTSLGSYCGFSLDQRTQLADIFKELSDTSGANKRSAGLADVVTLGDAWLGPAVQRGLVQPIPGADSYRWWRLLPPRMRALVRRKANGAVDPQGAVYGAPFRWGATLIAYRRDRLLHRGGRPVLDWSDLLQPALHRRLAMLEDPRELVAAAIRSLAGAGATGGGGGAQGAGGAPLSVNASAEELAAGGVSERVLQDRVDAFRRQVRLFSSRDHVRALLAGDVWAVVGYSQDLVQLAERSGNLALVAPLSGTQLWADVWTVPAGARGGHRRSGPSPLLPVWLEFTLSPGRITGQPGLKGGAPSVLLPSPSPSDSSPSSVLHNIQQHRRHLLAAHAANQAHSPLARALDGVRGALPALRPFLTDPRDTRDDEGANDEYIQGGGGADRDLADVANAASYYPSVELHHANGYLPPAAVLDRSEFLEPLEERTLELYRRVLGEHGAGGRVR